MPQYFLDSSALVKRYRNEVGSPWLLQISSGHDRPIVSRLSHVEVTSAIVRRGKSTEPSHKIANALARLDADMRSAFQIIDFSERLTSHAIELVKTRGLRAADAVQLACAMLSRAQLPVGTEFYLVSADDELNAAAMAEGLQVENPNQHP